MEKNPLLVIGTGGTGKWIVTYVKHALMDRHNRELLRAHNDGARSRPEWNQLPGNVKLLAFDVDAASDAIAEDARTRGVQLGAAEFTSFGGPYVETLSSFQDGNGREHYPEISEWLSQDDALCYDLTSLSGSAIDGAGQMRQIGRISLWLQMAERNIAQVIEQACTELSEHEGRQTKLTVIVAGSVAGGTGSGTFIDIAALARRSAQRTFSQDHVIIGFLVLPTTFNTVIGDAVERSRMAGNSYAALRELLRLNTQPSGVTIKFGPLLEVELGKTLLNVSYLVEGSRAGTGPDLSATKPWLGVDPAIADAIALHAEHNVDYSQIATAMQGQTDAAYSALGAVSYIAPFEDMVHEFGIRLSRVGLDRLAHGLSSDNPRLREAASAKAAVTAGQALDSLLNQSSGARPQLLAWVDQILSSVRVQQLTTAAHMQYLRTTVEGATSPGLPSTNLSERVPVAPPGRKGSPPKVKQAAERLMQEIRGGKEDEYTGRPGAGQSAGAVIGLYRRRTRAQFRTYLEDQLLGILNEGSGKSASARAGGLAAGAALLTSLSARLDEFKTRLRQSYIDQQTVTGGDQRRTKLDLANEAKDLAEADMLRDEGIRDRINNHAEQMAYRDCCKAVLDLEIQGDIHSATLDAIEDCLVVVGAQLREVQSWLQTFVDDLAELTEDISEVTRIRRDMAQVVVRRYVTDSEDAVERALWLEQLGSKDGDDPVDSTAAKAVTSEMLWSWSDASGQSLLLTEPSVSAARAASYWNDDGRAGYERRVTERFAPLRALTIWELLDRARRNAKQVAGELLDRSGPLTGYNRELQARKPQVNVSVKEVAIGNWLQQSRDTRTDGALKLSSDVQSELKGRRPLLEFAKWDDPHMICVVQMAHFIKMGALSCRPELRKEYERLVTGVVEVENTTGKTPVHVLPGEREAIKLELKSDRLIQSSIELSAAMIARLEERESMVLFGRAMLTDTVVTRRTAEGERYWQVTARLHPDEDEIAVELGRDLVGVCDAFLAPKSTKETAAREAMIAATEHQAHKMGETAYWKQVSTAARKTILPEDAANPIGRLELDNTLRLLLRERSDFMRGE